MATGPRFRSTAPMATSTHGDKKPIYVARVRVTDPQGSGQETIATILVYDATTEREAEVFARFLGEVLTINAVGLVLTIPGNPRPF